MSKELRHAHDAKSHVPRQQSIPAGRYLKWLQQVAVVSVVAVQGLSGPTQPMLLWRSRISRKDDDDGWCDGGCTGLAYKQIQLFTPESLATCIRGCDSTAA